MIAMAMAAAVLVSPAVAQAATVTFVPPSGNENDRDYEDGYIEVIDAGTHRNDLTVRFSKDAVLVVEHGRPPLNGRGGCRRRSRHVVICRVAPEDSAVYLDAGAGADVVRCRNGDISMDGGAGNDRLLAGNCDATMRGGSGDDVLVGGRFADVLSGGWGDDQLRGGGGNDTLYGEGSAGQRGSDLIDGGSGRDTAAWDERSRAIRADLRRGLATSRGERDLLRHVENLTGSTGNDVLAGDNRRNLLQGAAGKDLLVGRGGDDVLDGSLTSLIYSDGYDGAADHFRCDGGGDTILTPEKSILPVGCELMEDAYRTDFAVVPARPRPAGPHSVDVPSLCDSEFVTCRRRAVIKARGRVIGRSALVTNPRGFVRVRLRSAAPRNGVVTILVEGDDQDDPEFGATRYAYRFSWRLACRGAARHDVCRAGG